MKKIIILALFGLPASTALLAQPDNTFAYHARENKETSLPKSKFTLAQMKAEADFIRSNPQVTGVRWYADPNGYFVYYQKDSKRGKSFYNGKGVFVYSALSYSENELAQSMKNWILSSFDVKLKITHVNELRQNAKTIYLITVTDDKVWKKLRIEGEEMEVIQEFKAG